MASEFGQDIYGNQIRIEGVSDPFDSTTLSDYNRGLYVRDMAGNLIPKLNYQAKNKVTEPSFVEDYNKKNKDIKYDLFESTSGGNTLVLFELPNYSESGSVYILMRSIVSLSCSVARAKMPVVTLGENTVTGFALGNKTVAGSIIKTLTFNDEFDQAVSYFTSESLKEKEKNFKEDLSTKIHTSFGDNKYQITQKQFDAIMRDDLVPFNIYTYAFSEYTGKVSVNSIYGCTLINEGQVQSIENLITENTFTYIAKYAKLGVTTTLEQKSFQNLSTVMSGSKLLAQRKI